MVTKIGMLCVSALVLLILPLMIILPTSAESEMGMNLLSAELDDLTILHIGGGALASQVVDRLEQQGAHVSRSADFVELVEFDSKTAVIFGGEWFEGKVHNTELHDFLRLVSSRGAGLIMVGGTTSKFFEVLDEAEVYAIPVTETGEARNPAYFNPPVVGFRMKTEDGFTFPSIFYSCGTISDFDPAESFTAWILLDGFPN